MQSIKTTISADIARKIFGNKDTASKYLSRLRQHQEVVGVDFRTLRRGKRKGQTIPVLNSQNIWEIVSQNWDYETSKNIIRELFKETEKYKNGMKADRDMDRLIKEWGELQLGEIKWPFSQGKFDNFVQRINSENGSGIDKDRKVKKASVQFRRIKEINTVRNDFIETLIFEKNENIIPTLRHRKGVDFFIDGTPFDQKVAKSPTKEFKDAHEDNWQATAIANPELVARYLYTCQDEERFGSDPRLFIVYLDEHVHVRKIQEIIRKTNLDSPLRVDFKFNHATGGRKEYSDVPCFVILLHN